MVREVKRKGGKIKPNPVVRAEWKDFLAKKRVIYSSLGEILRRSIARSAKRNAFVSPISVLAITRRLKVGCKQRQALSNRCDCEDN